MEDDDKQTIVGKFNITINNNGITRECTNNIVLFHDISRGNITGVGFTLYYPYHESTTFGPYHRGKIACLEFTQYAKLCLQEWEDHYYSVACKTEHTCSELL
jgi:hypothetical protein